MKKLIKKSILNGLIRTFVSIFYSLFLKLKSNNNNNNTINSNKHLNKNEIENAKQFCHFKELNLRPKKETNHETRQQNEIKYFLQNFDDVLEIKKLNGSNSLKEDEYLGDEEDDEDEAVEEYDTYLNRNKYYSTYHNNSSSTQQIKLYPQNVNASKKSIDLTTTQQQQKYFRIRAIFVFVLIIIAYVSLNNYLIMFIYFQSSTNQKIFNAQQQQQQASLSSTTTPLTPTTYLHSKIQINQKFQFSSFFLDFKSFFFERFVKNKEKNQLFINNNERLEMKQKIHVINDEVSWKNHEDEVNGFKIFIDPIDVEVAGLNLSQILNNKYNNESSNIHRVLLDEAYFDEDEEINSDSSSSESKQQTSNNSNKKYVHQKFNLLKAENYELLEGQNNKDNKIRAFVNQSTVINARKKFRRPCVHPKLNPYDKEIMRHVRKESELKCNPKKNWIYVENGTLRVSKSAIKKHGTIVCAYIPLYRGNNDFAVYEGNRIFPVIDKMPLITDFFKIDCRSKDGAIYSNIHSGIAYESSLHMRHVWNPMPKKALGLNVLMFGFDSVSRMSWIRMLPKSYEYMVKEGFIVLKGYNIVGDGTPQALLPILTGKKETELPEARRGFVNASYVDVFPWIWKEFKKAGYVTQWAEDMQAIGTFQLRMLGFRKQPVDHYMRVFYLEAERYYNRFRRLCLGSISRHKNMINWVKEFFQMYESKPKFSFIFHSEASHNYNNPLSLLDNDLKEFLQNLKLSGAMENTALLFMSDHGVRVSDLRQYSQGKLEERTPFFSILMPRSFQEKYPNEMKNLRLNSRKLTTPFDIHETLKHLLNFHQQSNSASSAAPNAKPERGVSLFKYISPNRSCEDVQIEAHWCSCLNWIDVNITSSAETTNAQSLNSIENEKSDKDFDSKEEAEQSDNLSNNDEVKNSTAQTKKLIPRRLDYKEYRKIQSRLKMYSKTALLIANKAVDYMNSLIENEYKKFCEKIRLKSIERLSKLDLNRKLLAFKESKDIHGREAVFEDLNSTLSNNSEFSLDDETDFNQLNSSLNGFNLRNNKSFLISSNNKHSSKLNTGRNYFSQSAEIIFQVVLTTWPGNATYELSLKYQRTNATFKFNKNEISRINSYNGTSNCMLDKRPDLRQFCFCRFF